jgi:tryptophan synthase alpha chain
MFTLKRPSLVTFITAGDPNLKATLEFLHVLSKFSDVIELGIPFSDPMADGKTIQKANYRALKSGTRVKDVFNVVREFRESDDTPIVLMTYYNPIYAKGVEDFVLQSKDCGVDGLIVVDLPIEEAGAYLEVCHRYDMGTIFLASPNTPDDRLRAIDEVSSSFVYLVSLYGTTGARDRISDLAFSLLKRAKTLCSKPLAVGFGISSEDHVRQLIQAGADGVVVGSAIVRIIEELGADACDKIEEKCRELRRGLDI